MVWMLDCTRPDNFYHPLTWTVLFVVAGEVSICSHAAFTWAPREHHETLNAGACIQATKIIRPFSGITKNCTASITFTGETALDLANYIDHDQDQECYVTFLCTSPAHRSSQGFWKLSFPQDTTRNQKLFNCPRVHILLLYFVYFTEKLHKSYTDFHEMSIQYCFFLPPTHPYHRHINHLPDKLVVCKTILESMANDFSNNRNQRNIPS